MKIPAYPKRMQTDEKNYEAYDERYKTAHEKGVSWSKESQHPFRILTASCLLFKKTHKPDKRNNNPCRAGFIRESEHGIEKNQF